MNYSIAVLDDYQQVAARLGPWSRLKPDGKTQFFARPLPPDDLVAVLQPFEVIVAMRERTSFPRSVLSRLPRLRLLITTGMRNDVIDYDSANEMGILVCGTRSLGGSPTVELTWALILCLARSLIQANGQLHNGGWQDTFGMELVNRTLGIVGLGRVGARVATIGQAFGMNVVAWSQNLDPGAARSMGVEPTSQLALFSSSDFVTVHLQLSERTKGLIGASQFRAMKPSSYFVNTSRGAIVDTSALVEALQQNEIAGAGLDVFDQEPLPANSPLRRLSNAVLTPHLGYVTEGNYRQYFEDAVDGILAFNKHEPIRVLPT